MTPSTTKRTYYAIKLSPDSSHQQILGVLPLRAELRALGRDPDALRFHLLTQDDRILRTHNDWVQRTFMRVLGERGYRVVALERYPLTGMAMEQVAFHQTDLEAGLPPLDGVFDFILCADVLEHLRDPASLLRALRPLLAAGGALVASLPNSGHWYFRLNVLLGRFPRQDKGLFDRTHLHFCMWTNWVELFESAGLPVKLSKLTVPPLELRFPRSSGAPWLRLANRASSFLARTWKELFAYQFIVLARPSGRES